MSVFEDLTDQLKHGRKAHDAIMQTDLPLASEDMNGHCTYVCEWFAEDMPQENAAGTAMNEFVRHFVADSCQRSAAEMSAQEPPKAEDCLIFADVAGLCQRVLKKAPGGRIGRQEVVTRPCWEMTRDQIEAVIGKKQKWDLVLVGYALDAPASNSVSDILEQQGHVDRFMLDLLQIAFLADGCCGRLCVLTHDIFSNEAEAHEQRGLGIVAGSSMFGFLNTARLEVEFPVHLIDVQLTDAYEINAHVASEIFRLQTFGVNTVRQCWPYRLRKGRPYNRPYGRHVLRQVTSHRYEEAKKPFDLATEGVIAISGGNGALALVMGAWLLKRAEAQRDASRGTWTPRFSIQFLSRSMKIGNDNMLAWLSIQKHAARLGIHVEQARLDMGSQVEVDAYVASVTPHLVGFIHSAGVLRDAVLANQTWDKFEAVYDSKHRAAMYLHDALERYSNPGLRFLWLFSSTSALGNMGQLNYSASNSFLDCLARHRVALGKPCLSIQWGAWGEVGMAASMDEALRRRVMMGPMPYFTVAQGLQGLEGTLRTGLPGCSVFIANPQAMYGMIMGDEVPVQNYMRNFYGEMIPTPAPQVYDHKHAYAIYRMFRYVGTPYATAESGWLIYNHFVKPVVTVKDEKRDDREEVIEVDFL